jgi:hypothetical protein
MKDDKNAEKSELRMAANEKKVPAPLNKKMEDGQKNPWLMHIIHTYYD